MNVDLLMGYRWKARPINESEDPRSMPTWAAFDGPNGSILLYAVNKDGIIYRLHAQVVSEPEGMCAADYADHKSRGAPVREKILRMF